MLLGCSTIDCPFNARVVSRYAITNENGIVEGYKLSIYTRTSVAKDTLLLNQLSQTNTFELPISNTLPADTLFFSLTNDAGEELRDTIQIFKTNTPHFESVDCGINYFHTLQQIRSTHHTIDSIIINNPLVDYDTERQHILLTFKTLAP